MTYVLIKMHFLCIQFSLCWTDTVLKGVSGEYYSLSAALGQQHPEFTKQPVSISFLLDGIIYVLILPSMHFWS